MVVSVEPAAGAVQSLRNRFANTPSVTIVRKGVGSSVGFAEFYEFSETDCYNTFSKKWVDTLKEPTGGNSVAKAVNNVSRVPITTIDQLMLEFGVPDYVKIDVEGFELEVLKGLTRSLPLVSFECNLPEYLTETLECIALLRQRSNISEFNFCISEPADRFYSDVWLSSEEIGALVQNVTFRYMEIYCRTI